MSEQVPPGTTGPQWQQFCFGFEAYGSLAAMLDLSLTRLCSYIASDHHLSTRIAEKLGMTLEKHIAIRATATFLPACTRFIANAIVLCRTGPQTSNT